VSKTKDNNYYQQNKQQLAAGSWDGEGWGKNGVFCDSTYFDQQNLTRHALELIDIDPFMPQLSIKLDIMILKYGSRNKY